jgi:uncharacterized protein YbaP (TraB family)
MRRPLALLLSLVTAWALVACQRDSARKPAPAATGDAATSTTGPAASADDPWAPKLAPAQVIERPMIWAATRDGKTTYLFGTIHLGVNADAQLPAWLKAKLDGARVFAMEADLSDPKLLSSLQRTDGGSLRLDLGPAHWAKLEELAGKELAAGLDKMKPFAAMAVLEATFLPKTLPMDSVLETRARHAGKPLVYLELAMRQLEIVEPFMTSADVKAFLDNVDYVKAQSLKMLDAYHRGDEKTLAAMFDDQTLWKAAGRDPAQFHTFIKALLADRNEAWIPVIEKLHAEGGGFVAVGAGHLAGPHSVLDLLAARGYTITRLTGAPGEP